MARCTIILGRSFLDAGRIVFLPEDSSLDNLANWTATVNSVEYPLSIDRIAVVNAHLALVSKQRQVLQAEGFAGFWPAPTLVLRMSCRFGRWHRAITGTKILLPGGLFSWQDPVAEGPQSDVGRYCIVAGASKMLVTQMAVTA